MPAPLIRLIATPDLVEQVYVRLLDAISDGTLAPGQRVTQDEVAAQLAVSRQPVLQALRLLKQDGFVQDAPGRGVQVAPLDAAWIIQVYQVRGALDALAARLAAQQRLVVDPALITHGRAVARGNDVGAMISADLAFHDAIYEASRNPLIAQSAHAHWRHLRRAMGAVLQQAPQREALWDEHQAIADAIARGDGERAADLITRHAECASHNLTDILKNVLAARRGETPP